MRLIFGQKDARHEEFKVFDLWLQQKSPADLWRFLLIVIALLAAVYLLVG